MRSSHVRSSRFILAAVPLLLGLLVPAATVSADESRAPRVLALVGSSAAGDEASLDELVQASVVVELEARDIVAVDPSGPAGDASAALSQGASANADYVLWVSPSREGSEVSLDARWLDVSSGKETGRASRKGELNLAFDSLVNELVGELVDAARPGFSELAPLAPVEAAAPAAVAPGAPVETAAVVTAPEPSPAVSPAGELPSATDAQPPHVAPVALFTGAAPFIATFAARNYFPVGVSGWLGGQAQFLLPGGYGGIGGQAGVSAFHGRGAYAEADFYLVPVGVTASYGTANGTPLEFSVHVQFGPAVFIARPSTGETLAKVVPYVSAGLGVTLAVFDVVGISLDGSYTCFFDSPDPIMGFTPTLSVVVRF